MKHEMRTTQPISRRVLGLVLSVLMLLTIVPVTVFTTAAAETGFAAYINNEYTWWDNVGIAGIFSVIQPHLTQDGSLDYISAPTPTDVYIGYLKGNSSYTDQAGYDKWSSGFGAECFDKSDMSRIIHCKAVLHSKDDSTVAYTLNVKNVYAYIQQCAQTSMTFEGPGTIKTTGNTDATLMLEQGAIIIQDDANIGSEKSPAIKVNAPASIDSITGNSAIYSTEQSAIVNMGTIKNIAGGKIGYDVDGTIVNSGSAALSNEGTIDLISGGQILNLKNNGGSVTEITGGIFDYTPAAEGCLFSDDLMGKIKDGYIVKLLSKDGNGKFEVVKNEDVTDGMYLSQPTPADGYTVESDTETYSYNGKDYTVYTIPTPTFYDVTFDANGATGGTAPEADKVVEGTSYTVPGNTGALEKTNYTFAGWQSGDTTYAEGETIDNVTSALVLTAVWTPADYTIHFTAAFGNGAPSDMTAPYDSEFTIPDQVPTSLVADMEFLGWTYNGGTYFPGDKLKVTGNMTLAAKFGKAEYEITYDANGGEGAPATAKVGASATVSTVIPTKEGFDFVGWTDGTTQYEAGAAITLTGSITLTAVWETSTCTLTYDSLDESETVNYGESAVVTETIPEKKGYVFAGWESGTQVYAAGDSIELKDDLELTAKWTENPVNGLYCSIDEETNALRLVLPIDDASKYFRAGLLVTTYTNYANEEDMIVKLNADGTTESANSHILCTTANLAGTAQEEVWSSIISDGETYTAAEVAPKASYLYSYVISNIETDLEQHTYLHIRPFYIDVNGEITYGDHIYAVRYADGLV